MSLRQPSKASADGASAEQKSGKTLISSRKAASSTKQALSGHGSATSKGLAVKSKSSVGKGPAPQDQDVRKKLAAALRDRTGTLENANRQRNEQLLEDDSIQKDTVLTSLGNLNELNEELAKQNEEVEEEDEEDEVKPREQLRRKESFGSPASPTPQLAERFHGQITFESKASRASVGQGAKLPSRTEDLEKGDEVLSPRSEGPSSRDESPRQGSSKNAANADIPGAGTLAASTPIDPMDLLFNTANPTRREHKESSVEVSTMRRESKKVSPARHKFYLKKPRQDLQDTDIIIQKFKSNRVGSKLEVFERAGDETVPVSGTDRQLEAARVGAGAAVAGRVGRAGSTEFGVGGAEELVVQGKELAPAWRDHGLSGTAAGRGGRGVWRPPSLLFSQASQTDIDTHTFFEILALLKMASLPRPTADATTQS